MKNWLIQASVICILEREREREREGNKSTGIGGKNPMNIMKIEY